MRRPARENIIADLYHYGKGTILDARGEAAAGSKRLAQLAEARSQSVHVRVYYPEHGVEALYVWGGPTGVKGIIGTAVLQKGSTIRLSSKARRDFRNFLLTAGPTTLRRVLD